MEGNDLIQHLGIIKREMNLPMDEFIDVLENVMLEREQASCPVRHHFSPGLYIRELNMPAGTIAIGYRQKTRHLNIFLKGAVSMLDNNGNVKLMRAPMIFVGEPGRKVGFVHEDVVWLNIYPTTERDIDTLENMFLDKSDPAKQEYFKPVENIAAREDYKNMLAEHGISEDLVRAQSEIDTDLIPFPDGPVNVAVFDSGIEGKGLFASAEFSAGDIIAPARMDGKRTPAGRYTNHSDDPNSEPIKIGSDIYFKAIKDIAGCRGGKPGDEITIDYRKSIELKGLEQCLVL